MTVVLDEVFVAPPAAMYESDAWSRGIQLDEREDAFEVTSLWTLVIFDGRGRVVRELPATVAGRKAADALVARGLGVSWSEGDWFTIFPQVDTFGSAPLPGEVGVDQVYEGASGMPFFYDGKVEAWKDDLVDEDGLLPGGMPGIFAPLWATTLLTTPDKVEFTWEPVREAWELERAESEARWVEARAAAADELVDSIEALMMEVPA